jgi:putative redox protein
MQVKVEQLQNVKFAIHARHHTVICDQPADNGGADEGMTPPELMLASLGSCAAFYAAQYLKTRSLATGGVEVAVDAEKLKSPARLGNFKIEVHCPVALTEEHQSGLVRSVHSCLIHNTLMSVPEIAIELKVPALAG